MNSTALNNRATLTYSQREEQIRQRMIDATAILEIKKNMIMETLKDQDIKPSEHKTYLKVFYVVEKSFCVPETEENRIDFDTMSPQEQIDWAQDYFMENISDNHPDYETATVCSIERYALSGNFVEQLATTGIWDEEVQKAK
jgi:hypothetical protein